METANKEWFTFEKKKSALIPKSLNSDGVVKTMQFKNHNDIAFKTKIRVNLLSKHMYSSEHLRYTKMYIIQSQFYN